MTAVEPMTLFLRIKDAKVLQDERPGDPGLAAFEALARSYAGPAASAA